jgi:hypothetical protein
MKPRQFNDCPVDRHPMPDLPPLTLPVQGQDIKFLQASDIMIGGAACDLPEGQAYFVTLNISCPEKSAIGLFIALHPEHARDVAGALNKSAADIEAEILKGAPNAI